jgi:anti-anti-sigma factor
MKLEKFRHDEDGVRVVILKLTGDVDTFQVSALGERIDQMIAMGEVRVVLDLRLALYLGSTAIGALLRARKALAAQGGELVLAHPSGAVKRTLRTAGLDDVFRSVESVDDAIEHFHGGRSIGHPTRRSPVPCPSCSAPWATRAIRCLRTRSAASSRCCPTACSSATHPTRWTAPGIRCAAGCGRARA